jgi:hypothetical protein
MADSSTAWYFALTGPVTFKSITKRVFRRFFFEGGRFIAGFADSEGFLRLAIVDVILRNREAIEVYNLDFPKHLLDQEGRWDVSHERDSRDITGQLWPGPRSETALLRRRAAVLHEWQPTRQQVLALAAMVERRAGRPLPMRK